MTEKTCTGCRLEKPIEQFTKRTDRDGYQARCKTCVSEYGRKRYRERGYDRDAARARYRENRDRELARSAEWQRANPMRRAEYKMRRRAASKPPVPFTDEQLRDRMAIFGDRCWMCGAARESLDHVKPLGKGGRHMLANLRPACISCNASKRDRWDGPHGLDQFRRAASPQGSYMRSSLFSCPPAGGE